MSTLKLKNQAQRMRRYLIAFIAIVGGGMLSSVAYATTAANTTVTNTVTVDFEDAAANTYQVTDSASITVNLVEASPTLTLVSGPTPDPVVEGDDSVLTFRLTSNANGPDIYDLSQSESLTNVSASTLTNSAGATANLGGSSVAASVGGGVATFTVPYDGTDDGVANGLAAGDFIHFEGDAAATVYEIQSVDETTNGPGNNYVDITLTTNHTGLTYGDQIGESITFTLTVTAGTCSGTPCNTGVTECAQDDAAAAAQTCVGPTTVNVVSVDLTVTKYVQNTTSAQSPAACPGLTCIQVGGVDYFESGITGNPGDTLQYILFLDNSAGTADVENVRVSDPIPLYTTYTTGTMAIDDDGSAGVSGFVGQNDNTDGGDQAEYDATTPQICLYPDSISATAAGTDGGGGDTNLCTATNGGTISAGEEVYIRYDVTIDN